MSDFQFDYDSSDIESLNYRFTVDSSIQDDAEGMLSEIFLQECLSKINVNPNNKALQVKLRPECVIEEEEEEHYYNETAGGPWETPGGIESEQSSPDESMVIQRAGGSVLEIGSPWILQALPPQ